VHRCAPAKSQVFGCRNLLVEEKRRLEARVAQLEEEIDEERVELEQVTDKARKSAAQVHWFILQMYRKKSTIIHTICTKSRGPLVRVRIIHVM